MATEKSGIYSADGKKTVPLTGIEFHIDVIDICAKVSLRQNFHNYEDKPLEAVYCFPHESTAALYSMSIKNGTEEITAIAEEKEKAFDRYDMALEKGKKAFLLDKEEGDILIVSAGNLAPGADAAVEVKYIALLNARDSILRLQIPSTLMPRNYIPENIDPMKIDRVTPPYLDKLTYTLKISVSVKTKNISGAASPSHEIQKFRNSDGTWEISLRNETCKPDRDFILELHLEDQAQPLCLVSRHENGEEAALIRISPEFNENKKYGTEVISDILFLLDCSESMAGVSMIQAKEIIAESLQALREDDTFNILCFGKEHRTFYKESIKCNPANIAETLKNLSRVEADMGGTELKKVISHACSLPVRPGGTRSIILVTDGAVHNASDIIRDAVSKSRGARFYTFGTSYGASHHLIKKLAEANRGAWEMIQPGEKTAPKVFRQISRIHHPATSDLEILTQNIELILVEDNPLLYDGDTCTLLAKVASIGKDAAVVITGKNSGSSFTWKCKIENIGNDNSIPLLWAAEKISALECSPNASREKENEIKDIALSFNMPSSQTSLVGISKRKGTQAASIPEYYRIPISVPRGYEEYSTYEESAYSVQDAQAAYSGKTTEGKHELELSWYQKIINEQNPAGYFDNADLPAMRLGIDAKTINNTIKASGIYPETDSYNIVITLLTIKILNRSESLHAAIKPIEKANKWLSKFHDISKEKSVSEKIYSFQKTIVNESAKICKTQKF